MWAAIQFQNGTRTTAEAGGVRLDDVLTEPRAHRVMTCDDQRQAVAAAVGMAAAQAAEDVRPWDARDAADAVHDLTTASTHGSYETGWWFCVHRCVRG
jgi:hypothetical protein